MYLHGDLEDPEEPERPEDGEAEGAGLGLEVGPDLLEGGEGDDEGVEAVEGGLHVDARPQRPHPQEHLEDEEPEEDEFGRVCGGGKHFVFVGVSVCPPLPVLNSQTHAKSRSARAVGCSARRRRRPC